jgi:NAD(P)-dependent dehydrogenase (short-subunit alcohol dehydrogenase family)
MKVAHERSAMSTDTVGSTGPDGKAILITGGSSGLGAAVVSAVAKSGDRPFVLDRRAPAEDVPWVECDLADGRAAERAAARLADLAGGLDGVVTSAGVDVPGRLGDVPADTWERVVAVDLLGTVAVIRAALPFLERSHGTVVTVASTLGVKAVSDATAYCAAKFGVVGFTRALAAELAGTVGVTLLIPGGMRTGFFDGRDAQYKPGPDAILNDPAHVATAVLFALSQPAGCAVRELVVCAERETSYP